jgi:hypothetical protein
MLNTKRKTVAAPVAPIDAWQLAMAQRAKLQRRRFAMANAPTVKMTKKQMREDLRKAAANTAAAQAKGALKAS